MKKTVMNKEEPCNTTFVTGSNLLVVHFKITGIIFNGKQVNEIKKTDGNTLEPVDPYYRSKSIRVVLIIPDAVKITC